jgi:hypothetical protein
MYNVSFTNNYHFGLTVALGGENIAPGGGTGQFNDWGTTYITVPGMGDILFIDLGDTKLNRFTDPNLPWTEKTWGGLIRFQGIEAYFRYEGQGEVTATLDGNGTLNLNFTQGGMVVALPDIIVAGEGAAE